jgi:hypothetical protein
MDLLIMEALSVTATGFEQPSHGFFSNFGEPGGGSDTTPFIEMVNHIDRFGLAQFRVEQGGAASLGKFVLAAATAQQTEAVTAIHLTDDKIVLARLAIVWAFGIDAG